jgi:hypothetical protein
MKMGRLVCVLLPALLLSCAESGGSVVVDAQWNLSCPSGGGAGCGSLADETCLGDGGQREIVGEHRQTACTGQAIIAICEAVHRTDGTRSVTLEANIADDFAFELRGATIDTDNGIVESPSCVVTIIEDGVAYGGAQMLGGCGEEEPSIEQPCQLSKISTEGNEVVFDLRCESLLSSVTTLAFDVGAVGGGATTIRFANCIGF